MANSIVCIGKTIPFPNESELKNKLHQVLDKLCFSPELPPNPIISLKVNLCLLMGTETGATVDPLVAKLVSQWLIEHFNPKELVIIESDATHLSADLAFKVLEWNEMVKELPNTRILNLSKDKLMEMEFPNNTYHKRLQLPVTLMKSDLFVSLGKLKTHTLSSITCILKNQIGINPKKIKIINHPRLTESIVDLNCVRKPDLCIIDGLVAMEGNGPTRGIPKPLGLIVASNDPVSIDHLCAKLIGFNPKSIEHLVLARKRNLGSFDYILYDLDNCVRNYDFIKRNTFKKLITKYANYLRRRSGILASSTED